MTTITLDILIVLVLFLANGDLRHEPPAVAKQW